MEDLKNFYDRYLKDIRNGWELTPKVRIEVMDDFDVFDPRQPLDQNIVGEETVK